MILCRHSIYMHNSNPASLNCCPDCLQKWLKTSFHLVFKLNEIFKKISLYIHLCIIYLGLHCIVCITTIKICLPVTIYLIKNVYEKINFDC